jgi:hypothetical protein
MLKIKTKGDQVGRIFAQRVIVYSEQFKATAIAYTFGLFFYKSIHDVLHTFDKKWVGMQFGRFFKTHLVTLEEGLFFGFIHMSNVSTQAGGFSILEYICTTVVKRNNR